MRELEIKKGYKAKRSKKHYYCCLNNNKIKKLGVLWI